MKRLAYIVVISLAFLGVSCNGQGNGQGQMEGQSTQAPAEGYGANESGLRDDNQTGAGQVDNSRRGASSSDNGGNMNNTSSGNDTLHHLGDVNETEAARATEKTQQQVGNNQNRGEANQSQSRTTKNEVIKQ